MVAEGDDLEEEEQADFRRESTSVSEDQEQGQPPYFTDSQMHGVYYTGKASSRALKITCY